MEVKNMRKTFALLMAIALIISAAVLPVLAEEEDETAHEYILIRIPEL